MAPSKVPIEESIASTLLSIGAVSLKPYEPFTWASGLLSPVYCDNRLIMGYPEARKLVVKGFQDLLNQHDLAPELIAGTATAGIPHAAWLAHEANLPMVYIRSKAKEHGRMNQVEGPIHAGQTAIIIEDLISTGKSSINAVKVLVEEGVKVLAVFAIFTYGFGLAQEAFESAGVPFHTLTSYEQLLQVAVQEKRLEPEDLEVLRAWRNDPQSWSDSQN